MTLARRLFSLLPHSELLYRISRRYVDRYEGNNNVDMATNGELLFMRRVLPKAKVVFDVGANVGDWAVEALAINPNATIHCFEPSASTFATLRAKNLGPNVLLNPFALGDTAGAATLFVHDEYSGVSSLYDRQKGLEEVGFRTTARGETITIRTGVEYCAERGVETIDFLKVDVEGHELSVFRGFAPLFAAQRIRTVQFEYGGTNIDAHVLLKDIWEFLEPHGYRFYKLFPAGPRLVPKYSQAVENFRYQNWAASLDEP